LKAWVDTTKLLAQLSGEMVEKKEISVNNTFVNERLITMLDGDDADGYKVIEVKSDSDEVKLIE